MAREEFQLLYEVTVVNTATEILLNATNKMPWETTFDLRAPR